MAGFEHSKARRNTSIGGPVYRAKRDPDSELARTSCAQKNESSLTAWAKRTLFV